MNELDGFYTAFEDRFRGSFAEIKARLVDYLPELDTLSNSGVATSVLDLGCGRGEWLELLSENQIQAEGIEQNPVSAARAIQRGLRVTVGDIFAVMSTKPAESYGVVTAFHVVEHLPWPLQLQLFQDAYRLLLPGGMLILEWPNIESIHVAAGTFWLDPTHLRPYPAALASFMAEYAGFEDIRTLRFRPQWADAAVRKASPLSRIWRRLISVTTACNRSADSLAVEKAMRGLLTPGHDIALLARKGSKALESRNQNGLRR